MPKEKDYFGINYNVEVPYAYCGKYKWNIKPPTRTTIHTMQESTEVYNKKLEKIKQGDANDPVHLQIYEDASKAVLEATLEDFDYEKYADDPDVGVVLLGHLTGDVRIFLLNGGKHGNQRLQTSSNTPSGT